MNPRHRSLPLLSVAAVAAWSPNALADTARDSWYIGFGFGSGPASATFAGESLSYGDLFEGSDSPRISVRFELGGTLSEQLLLGVHLAAIREEADGVGVSLQHTQVLAMLSYFPAADGKGFFVRGGVGPAMLRVEVDVGGFGFASATQGGAGIGLGLGYAFWLGETFNLTLSNDLHLARFNGDENLGEPTSGWFDAIEIGFLWY